ncbi:MAG TPA: response regulator [Polyangia bacterium]|jgi:two-component system phosphate regulon sensor histidine kinase PhoR|nr:response regulator [Polyangia bacterium]
MSSYGAMASGGTRHGVIWVADDSPMDAGRAQRALAKMFHTVEVFPDGATVLEALASRSPPDVIVLDWIMPGISGLEVCEFLRSSRGQGQAGLSGIAVLLLTAHQHPDQVVRGLKAGANDYLSKPYADEELQARVQTLLRSKELLDRVARAEDNVRRLLANAPDALVAVDAQGRLSYANAEAERIFDSTADALVGRPVTQLLPDLPLRNVNLRAGESFLPLPDITIGQHIYSPTVRLLPADFAASTTIALRDVTEQRHAEARRLDFYSIIAHDLRSPLSAIQLRTDLILRGRRGILSAELINDIRKIDNNVRSLVELINDFLDLARLEGIGYAIEREPVDLPALLHETLADIQPLIDESQLTVQTLGLDEIITVLGDRRRLVQVLTNLLSNAVKFTLPGGVITVEMSTTPDAVEVRVSDTGRGIPADVLPNLFQRYMRAADRGNKVAGTGLGLMIVREIVEAHGGTVGVESELGQGSTFWFQLPKSPPEAQVEQGPPPVVIVDDDEDVRASLRFVLETEGYHVMEARHGREALSLFETCRPAVVLLDLNMPVMDGWELADRMAADPRLANIPICVISASMDPAPPRVQAVLTKPIRVEQLLSYIERWRLGSQA